MCGEMFNIPSNVVGIHAGHLFQGRISTDEDVSPPQSREAKSNELSF